jgi:hypothetical protein
VQQQRRSRFCAAATAAPSLLMTAPTRASSCWKGRQHEGERRSGQPRTSAATTQTDADTLAVLLEEACTAVALLEEAHTVAADGSTESAAFTGDMALSPRFDTVVTTSTKLSSGTSAPAAGGLPSPRPTTLSGLR